MDRWCPVSLSHDKIIFCNLGVFHSLSFIWEMYNSPKSECVNTVLIQNKELMLKNETSNGKENITLYKIISKTDVLIKFINNMKSWMTTQFIGMILWHKQPVWMKLQPVTKAKMDLNTINWLWWMCYDKTLIRWYGTLFLCFSSFLCLATYCSEGLVIQLFKMLPLVSGQEYILSKLKYSVTKGKITNLKQSDTGSKQTWT
jgi:hypothetical protein